MRVVAFANNRVGRELVAFLAADPDTELVGLVAHPPEKGRYVEEILAASGLPADRRLTGPALKTEIGRARLAEWQAQLGVSFYFGYILAPAVLQLFPGGCINLHPALLPYNRGAHTNVWSLIDGTPAGVTIHQMDEGVDTGAILAQRELATRPTDTGETLYRRLEEAAIELFQAAWPDLRAGRLVPRPQQAEAGTFHRARDVAAIDEIDLDASYPARELIARLRARTFPPYPGCYFRHQGRKVFMRLSLWEEE